MEHKKCEPLLKLAQDRGRLLVAVAALVDAGADMEAFDCEGRTALHLAAGCGDCAMTLRLLELGAQVNARDSVGGALAPTPFTVHFRDMVLMYAICATVAAMRLHACSSVAHEPDVKDVDN